MSRLIEHRSRKAARVLESARGLVLDHGIRKVTVAEIAKAAGVGKGTVYLYWPSKEDLIVGLFAREVLRHLELIADRLTAAPADAMPSRLAPLLLRTGHESPLVQRLTATDVDLLRQLVQQSGARELFDGAMPAALCDAVMPVLGRHRLLRTDRPVPDQSFTMHALLTGFGAAAFEPESAPKRVNDLDAILADTVARVVDAERPPAEAAVAEAAADVAAIMRRTAEAVVELIGRTEVGA